MTMKSGLIAALAVMLLAAVLVIGCVEPLSGLLPGGSKGEEQPLPPAGMGYVRLSVDDGNARSIVPGAPVFTQYKLTFKVEPAGTTLSGYPQTIAAASIGTAIPLPPGDYSLTVVAETGDGIVAEGTAYEDDGLGDPGPNDVFTIAPAGSATVHVLLEMIAPGTGTGGIFDYTVGFTGLTGGAASLTTATMTITARGTKGTTPDNSPGLDNVWNLKTLAADEIDLDDGFYNVVFELAKYSKTVYHRQILHIYQNMTSSYTYNVVDAQFPAPGSVTIVIVDPGIHAGKLGLDYTYDATYGGGSSTAATWNEPTSTITLSITGNDAGTVELNGTITNAEWFINGAGPAATGDTFDIVAGVAPFSAADTYTIYVWADDDDVPCDIEFTVVITP